MRGKPNLNQLRPENPKRIQTQGSEKSKTKGWLSKMLVSLLPASGSSALEYVPGYVVPQALPAISAPCLLLQWFLTFTFANA